MPSERNYIDVLVRMVNAAKFERDAAGAARAVKHVGDQTEQAGKKARISMGQLAKWGTTTLVFQRAAGYLKGAVHETENLAKQSLQLQRLTGMDVKLSSEWITLAEQRGIESNRLGMMFTQLGRVQQRAVAGAKMQTQAFASLGVSAEDLRTLDASGLIVKVADAFAAMPDGLAKAALAQQLFGRTGRQLLPLLNSGSQALADNLDMVERYGAALEGKTAEDVKAMITRQREMDLAMRGVKEQVADALIPVLTSLAPTLTSVAQALQPFTKNATLMRVVVVALTVGWIAYTGATIAAALSTATLGAVLWGTGIAVALLGIAVVVVLLASHWDQVREALGQVWDVAVRFYDWVRSHWQAALLAVPFGPQLLLAIRLVRDNFDSVKAAIRAVVRLVEWAARKVEKAWHAIRHPIETLKGWVGGGDQRFAAQLADARRHAAGRDAYGMPAAAMGGTVTSAGAVLVGEAGPEVVHLPQRAVVEPLPRRREAGTQGGGFPTAITVPLIVDGRELARATWKATADAQARA